MQVLSYALQIHVALALLIVGVSAAGFRQLLRAWRHASAEEQVLERLAPEAAAAEQGLDEREAARSRIEAMRLAVAEGKRTATHRRIERVSQAARHGLSLDRAALASAAEDQLFHLLRAPRAMTNLLVLVGLAGTLGGLTQAVSGLGGFKAPQPLSAAPDTVISAEQVLADQSAVIDGLLKAVQDTLSGMKTAFIPALIAVIATVLLLAGVQVVQGRLQDLLGQLENVTEVVLLPLYRPGSGTALLEAQAQALNASRALIDASEQSSAALARSLGSLETQMCSSAEGAAAIINAGSNAALDALRSWLSEAAAGTRDAQAALVRGASDATKLMSTSAARAAADADKVAQRSRSAVAELDAGAGRLARVLANAETVASGVARAVSAGGNVAELVADAGTRYETAAALIASALESTRREAGRHGDTAARLAQALEDLEQTRAAMRDLVALQQQWHRETLSRVDQQGREVAASVEAIREFAATVAAVKSVAPQPVTYPPAPDTAAHDQRLLEFLAETINDQNRRSGAQLEALLRELRSEVRAIRVFRGPRAEPTTAPTAEAPEPAQLDTHAPDGMEGPPPVGIVQRLRDLLAWRG